MTFKPSKYNYVHKSRDGSLRLYNSARGTQSLSYVDSDKAMEVAEILKTGADELVGESSKLAELGYLVPNGQDEDILKKFRVMETVMDNPLHLILLPTEGCNFRCKYCYETFSKGVMSKQVQESIVSYVRKNINKHNSLLVSWFGGEPLEALDVIEYLSSQFINICKTARKNYAASMTTNGYNLTLDTYNRLYKLGVYNYQVTIDGLKEEHDNQRVLENGSGTFEKIIENLLVIKENTNYFNSSFIIRTNFTKRIFERIDEYLKFFSDAFGNDNRFNFYIHIASDWGGERIAAFNEEMLSKNQYRDILNHILKSGYSLNLSTHFSHLNYKNCICYASQKNSVVIGSDATLYKCTGDFEYEKNKVGILMQNGNMQYNNNFELWIGGLHNNDKKCDNCFFSGCCLSNNCPAVRVRGLPNDICSFEKEHLGLFMELFDK